MSGSSTVQLVNQWAISENHLTVYKSWGVAMDQGDSVSPMHTAKLPSMETPCLLVQLTRIEGEQTRLNFCAWKGNSLANGLFHNLFGLVMSHSKTLVYTL